MDEEETPIKHYQEFQKIKHHYNAIWDALRNNTYQQYLRTIKDELEKLKPVYKTELGDEVTTYQHDHPMVCVEEDQKVGKCIHHVLK